VFDIEDFEETPGLLTPGGEGSFKK
jgi:hypothetical protein